jgi:hypothetical protein
MNTPKPIVLRPLSPDDALRRAMQVPAPASDPKPVKAKKKAAPKKAAKKKRATG